MSELPVTAKIAVDAAAYWVDRPFDYLVPPSLRETAVPGVRVVVPFGRGNHRTEGIILSLSPSVDGKKLKSIVSVLDRDTPFSAFEQFGFQSGRDTDKLKDYWFKRTDNGLAYFPQFANAVFSAKVVDSMDLGSHTLFIGEVTDAVKLSDAESLTYERYQSEIKPKKPAPAETKGWRCTVCGYIYEGEELPADFVCPVCKHGAEVFEKI